MADLAGTTLGNYRVAERIGRGGMAVVYKAYQPALERYVAIKVIHEQLAGDDEQVSRLHARILDDLARLPENLQDVRAEREALTWVQSDTEAGRAGLHSGRLGALWAAAEVGRRLENNAIVCEFFNGDIFI